MSLGVVVLAASEGGAAALGPALKANRVQADERIAVTLITPHAVEQAHGVKVLRLPSTRRGALATVARAMQNSMIGRNVARFTPLDPNARFYKELKRHPDAYRTALEADMLIAADRNSILAAWRIARRSRKPAQQGLNAGFAAVIRQFNRS